MVDVRQPWPNSRRAQRGGVASTKNGKKRRNVTQGMGSFRPEDRVPTGTLRLFSQARNGRWREVRRIEDIAFLDTREAREGYLAEWAPEKGHGSPVVMSNDYKAMRSFRESGLATPEMTASDRAAPSQRASGYGTRGAGGWSRP